MELIFIGNKDWLSPFLLLSAAGVSLRADPGAEFCYLTHGIQRYRFTLAS